MTIIGYKRLTIILLLLLGGLLGFALNLALKGPVPQIDELGTWSAIVGYGRLRDQALRSDPHDASSMLYTIAYLPPQRTNEPLDWIVQRERKRDASDVIEYLRRKTGEDLGDDPAKWIQKYDPEESQH